MRGYFQAVYNNAARYRSVKKSNGSAELAGHMLGHYKQFARRGGARPGHGRPMSQSYADFFTASTVAARQSDTSRARSKPFRLRTLSKSVTYKKYLH